VLFEAPVAASLLGHFASAVSGGSLYRKSSFLLDSLGQTVFAPIVQIRDAAASRAGSRAAPSTRRASPRRRATSSRTAS
jgi:PmbA protein